MVFLAGSFWPAHGVAAATRLLGQRQQSRQKRQILNVAADANVAAVPTTADTIPSPREHPEVCLSFFHTRSLEGLCSLEISLWSSLFPTGLCKGT